ncbi:MAG: hypothetical protein Q9190_007219 [Brigantiaea leucoxantha]
MASVKSLGVHRPSAVPFLVAEGILPPEPSEQLFTWQTIDSPNADGWRKEVEEEELLITSHCVVWSRGSIVERLFRFDVEGEAVSQAIFTTFAQPAGSQLAGILEAGHANAEEEIGISSLHSKSPAKEDVLQERALVVLLKSQAHIFFVSGTSHIVHLPFEVESIFPSPHGILVQRKLPRRGTAAISAPHEPQYPTVPSNSFIFSQSSAGLLSGSQAPIDTRATDKEAPMGQIPQISLLLSNLRKASTQNKQIEAPRLYCLLNPIDGIGLVTAKSTSMDMNWRHSPSATIGPLDPKEDLLYVSPQDESAGVASGLPLIKPFLLAVTLNRESGACTVWSLEYVDNEDLKGSQSRHQSTASGIRSRRRSSYRPGASTGVNTPTVRGNDVRETNGTIKSKGPNGKDLAAEDTMPHPAEDLFKQLEPAFEDPTAPAKSSRRVSSLLARADLSASHDNPTFADLAGAHGAAYSSRRGVSLGASGARTGGSLDAQFGTARSRPMRSTRASIESQSIYESDLDEMIDEYDDLDGLRAFNSLDLTDKTHRLRKDINMKRIHSFPAKDIDNYTLSGEVDEAVKPKIFTIRSPYSSLREDARTLSIHLCFVNAVAQSVVALEICAQLRTPKRSTTKEKERNDALNINLPFYASHIGHSTKLQGVIDVCKIRQGDCSRILMLKQGPEGSVRIMLQAPWSRSCEVRIPSPLNLYDPFLILPATCFGQTREGSLKRVIGQPLQPLIALQHVSSDGRVDVVDSGSVRHRIQIRLKPHQPLVHQMIKVCDAVSPVSTGRKEEILLAWWDVMSWLKARPEQESELEWTAFVVAIFSIAAKFIRDSKSDAVSHKRRRKGTLLRSSSGANTDLESWEEMLNQESGASGAVPSWMRGPAWEWTIQNDKRNHWDKSNAPQKVQTTSPSTSHATNSLPGRRKVSYILHCLTLAREFARSPAHQPAIALYSQDVGIASRALACILQGLHLFREELKLDILNANAISALTPILAQLGGWLGWKSWGFRNPGFYTFESAELQQYLFDESVMVKSGSTSATPFEPPSVLQHLENLYLELPVSPFMTLVDVVRLDGEMPHEEMKRVEEVNALLMKLTPRSLIVTESLNLSSQALVDPGVTNTARWTNDLAILETLPEGIAALHRTAISQGQRHPSTRWNSKVLRTVGRDDIASLGQDEVDVPIASKTSEVRSNEEVQDVHAICNSSLEVEAVGPYDGSAETERQSIIRMIFKDDQRYTEATKLIHPLQAPTAYCSPQPDWSDTDLLEAQQELVKTVALRTLSVSTGRGLLLYGARLPLLTEKFPIHGFTLSCVMKPASTTVTADRNAYTEDKVSWAFFHAGVEAGLSISKYANGIDTSWILFNKPQELRNRHAGFLLALGLNGHLKSIAKWVAFKYLTPKHPMTSIGLLLGLSASYIGTMDSLITRLLSVHVTRMLPPGAAELNLSPLTQTSGIMGIGLLYCNTQHRRMSEIMLSEMENVENDDAMNPLENLRDEGYRLAAGFALGYINLGRGQDLRGLHDMRVVERLLILAIGTKKVSLVHILDKATAAATIAIALIFMKTQDAALAHKIDVPDTIHQFDYVRPDIFLLRTVARHLIMWNNIRPHSAWMREQLPQPYQYKARLTNVRALSSDDMPFLNIVAGLCLSIGLRFAGTGSIDARNILCHYLDQFIRICRLPATNYDSKLARITVRNCQDTVALSAACIMAGTGDLLIFRRLRSLHGRCDPDTPYGSHLAAHMAIGVLFLGGGTHTFGTSNIAVASLLCAFYPLFPPTVMDNKSHLQAFRHFWVLATESRCLIARDVDTHQPVSLRVIVSLRDGSERAMTAPCLLPDLTTISRIQTEDSDYWGVTLDLAAGTTDLTAFRRHQNIYVRRRAAYDLNSTVFSGTMQTLNSVAQGHHHYHQSDKQVFEWIFTLPVFNDLDAAERDLILHADVGAILRRDLRSTVVDDRLVLENGCMESGRSERLWNLRLLFAWASRLAARGEEWTWLREENVNRLRAKLSLKICGELGAD